MKAALKRAWVKALRSRKYKQGPNQLHDQYGGTHCCLGVLYHVVVGRNDNRNKLLGNSMLVRVGLSVAQQTELAGMNDRGDSFEKIADWIVLLL